CQTWPFRLAAVGRHAWGLPGLHPADRFRSPCARRAAQLGNSHHLGHSLGAGHHRPGLRTDWHLRAARQRRVRSPESGNPQRGAAMIARLLAAAALFAASPLLLAGEALTGEVQKQPTNWTAIIMFVVFIVFTMGITKWASKRNTSTSDYYTAGGSITGFQN